MYFIFIQIVSGVIIVQVLAADQDCSDKDKVRYNISVADDVISAAPQFMIKQDGRVCLVKSIEDRRVRHYDFYISAKVEGECFKFKNILHK